VLATLPRLWTARVRGLTGEFASHAEPTRAIRSALLARHAAIAIRGICAAPASAADSWWSGEVSRAANASADRLCVRSRSAHSSRRPTRSCRPFAMKRDQLRGQFRGVVEDHHARSALVGPCRAPHARGDDFTGRWPSRSRCAGAVGGPVAVSAATRGPRNTLSQSGSAGCTSDRSGCSSNFIP